MEDVVLAALCLQKYNIIVFRQAQQLVIDNGLNTRLTDVLPCMLYTINSIIHNTILSEDYDSKVFKKCWTAYTRKLIGYL